VVIPRVPTRLKHGDRRAQPPEMPPHGGGGGGLVAVRRADRGAIVALMPHQLRRGAKGTSVQGPVGREITDHVPALSPAESHERGRRVPAVEEDVDSTPRREMGCQGREHLARHVGRATKGQPLAPGPLPGETPDRLGQHVQPPVNDVRYLAHADPTGDDRQAVGVALALRADSGRVVRGVPVPVDGLEAPAAPGCVAGGIVQADRDAPALWGYRSQPGAHLSQHIRPHRGTQHLRSPRALAKDVGHGVDIARFHQLAGDPGQRLPPVGHKEPFHNLFQVAAVG
jgi:hypothetical protein